ncbi:MAG: repeat-containing protein [Gemmatimonadales bacterium]|nr:repeat-containing protein [Gemmatimonadales bacterium]
MPMSKSHPINPSVNRLARQRRLCVVHALSLAMIALALASSAASSQTPGATPQPVVTCASEPERHRFDFWIGEWDVTTKAGSLAGHSVIQSVSGGCALLENWTSLRGGNGKSLNAWNPSIKQWQQFWIGQDGQVAEYRSSEMEGTSLVFFIRSEATPSAITRLRFTPVDSATVRQHSESSADAGKTWKTDYDFYYHRKALQGGQ